MKRYSPTAGGDVEAPAVDVFIEEVLAVCQRHGLSLGHEDDQGAFKVVLYDEHYAQWLRDAYDSRGEPA